jgi:hypothetical protein
MTVKTLATALRLLFLAGAILFTSLGMMPKKSHAIRCNADCGAQGPIACNYPCRRPE